jgi:hypothetical protein
MELPMSSRTLLVLLLPVALLSAQDRPAGTPEAGRADNKAGVRTERPRREPAEHPFRARLRARLHEIRTQRIQKALGVPEAKATAIADCWGRFEVENAERRQGMHAARGQIQEALLGPGSEEEKNARVRPVMERFAALRKAQLEARGKWEEETKAMLTPVQQGRFLILAEEFQREVQASMRGGEREKQP